MPVILEPPGVVAAGGAGAGGAGGGAAAFGAGGAAGFGAGGACGAPPNRPPSGFPNFGSSILGSSILGSSICSHVETVSSGCVCATPDLAECLGVHVREFAWSRGLRLVLRSELRQVSLVSHVRYESVST